MTGSRFCVTGGGGYFGQCLAKELQAQGHHVVLLDIQFVDSPAVRLRENALTRIKGSVLDRKTLEEALVACDACFHIAAYGMSGSPSLDSKRTHEVNVVGTENVIQACIKLNVPRLVFASSVGVVFTDQEIVNGDETMPYAPLDKHVEYYSVSKTIAEKRVLEMDKAELAGANKTSQENELRTCALRFRGIYGPGEPRTTLRTAEMCRKGLMMITFGQKKECLTQYSGVDNSVQACRLAEEALRADRQCRAGGQAYFIVDGGPPVDSFQFWRPLMDSMGIEYPRYRLPYKLVYFIAFLMECLFHLTGIEPVFTRLEVNLIGVTNYYSIDKAKKDLGYRPTHNHDLKGTVAYFEKFFADQTAIADESKTKPGRPLDPKLLFFLMMVGAVFLWYALDFVIE